ncbi:Ryanodine receptor 3 [Cichlidogyrus casuarinus]|uniref:Ryanodine receptor 3 n=1 Tax=Cichlidogyrus casuarinus TaxID=1844966 RepID=A0ABD2QMJ7_9PLAT
MTIFVSPPYAMGLEEELLSLSKDLETECVLSSTLCPPPNMQMCVFILDQALSVRALQELLAVRQQETSEVRNLLQGAGSGHRTLLYGHAIRLQHLSSKMVSNFTVFQYSTLVSIMPVYKLNGRQACI